MKKSDDNICMGCGVKSVTLFCNRCIPVRKRAKADGKRIDDFGRIRKSQRFANDLHNRSKSEGQ